MTPKFVAVGDLIIASMTNPAVMATPKAAATLADTSTGLKMMFTYVARFCRRVQGLTIVKPDVPVLHRVICRLVNFCLWKLTG
jgi:hypothetical protein